MKTTERKLRGFESHPLLTVIVGLVFTLLDTSAVAGVPSPAPGGRDTDLAQTRFAGSAPAEIGARHPALELDALDETLINSQRMTGRPFVVEFFATWCSPCHRALADLHALRAASAATLGSIPVLLVDVGESPEVVRRWLTAAGVDANTIVALDRDGLAAHRWGARRLPTTFLVDAQGIVRHINRGWGPGYRARLSRWLTSLTTAPAGRPLH